MSDEQRKYKIFGDKYTDEFIEKNCKLHNLLKDKEQNPDLIYYYKNILTSLSSLMDKLGVVDPLKIAVIYSFLLENGYLSTNQLDYNSNNNSKYILLAGAEVATGRINSLASAEMLTRLLQGMGYNSDIISGKSNNGRVDYNIKMNNSFYTRLLKLKSNLISLFECSTFSLINYYEIDYIYDPINVRFYYWDDFMTPKSYGGNDTINLKYDLLLKYSGNKDRINEIIFNYFRILDPLTEEDIKTILKSCETIWQENQFNFKEFYQNNLESMHEINKILSKK